MTGTPVYAEAAVGEVARLLSWLDREPFSRTYGAFDRTFWCWKFSDFPAARFQEGVYALAHLWASPRVPSGLAGDGRALEWLRAGFDFWRSIQYRDGSFDEAYPFERSLAATAFTGFYVAEAYLRVETALDAGTRAGLRASLAMAGDWLCRNDERHGVLSNHLAAAAAALQAIHRVTGDDAHDRRARHFVTRILDRQSGEGWYEEYGGADPGYQTHATFYLARVWQRTGDAALLTSLERSIGFLKHFVHPNGTLGGEYASRNTEFYFPAGLEMLAPRIGDAATIAHRLRRAVAERSVPGPWTMDAWNALPILNNYLFADEHQAPLGATRLALPCEEEGEWYFRDAGLLVKTTSHYYAVVGLSKGGVVRVYDRATSRLALSDCGYWLRLRGGRVASSQALDRASVVVRDGDASRVTVPFVEINQRVPSPVLFLGFRLFSLTVGRLRQAAYWMKQRLVQILVKRRRTLEVVLERSVSLSPTRIHIRDTITGARDAAESIETLRRGDRFATIHMGSSRYFSPQEMEPQPASAVDLAAALAAHGSTTTERSWPEASA